MHIRQPEISPGIPMRQLLVIEAEQMQESGVQVVDVDLVLHRLEAEVVGSPVGMAAADAAAGQPLPRTHSGCARGPPTGLASLPELGIPPILSVIFRRGR